MDKAISSRAFGPEGNSHYMQAVASPAAGNAIQPSSGGNGMCNYRIFVATGSAVVALGWGTTATEAAANAALPTAGTPKQCLVMSAGSIETFTLPEGSHLAARSTANADIYVTAGSGV